MSFMGRESVVRARDLKRDYGGKLVSGTLTPSDGSTAVTFANIYLQPASEDTALGRTGTPEVSAAATVYRMGETSRPRADDTLSVGDFDWLVLHVTTRLNADESTNYAVYDCRLVRPATSAG
jgi:hypothetical protein